MRFVEPFNRHKHHVEDGIDFFLVGFDVGALELEHHRGRRRLAFFYKQAAVRNNQVHARALHIGKFADSTRKFALQGACVVDLLHKVGLADLDLVKNFKTYALPHQAAFASDLDAFIVHHFLGHKNGLTVVGKLIHDLVCLKRLDDNAGVFGAKVGIQHLIIWARSPNGKADGSRADKHQPTHDGHALHNAHFGPDCLDGIDKLHKKSRHKLAPAKTWRNSGALAGHMPSQSNCHATY